MSEEYDNSPIGDPEAAEPNHVRMIMNTLAGVVGMSLGWVVAFAYFINPTPVRGATRSGRLKWRLQQDEVPPSAVVQAAAQSTTAPITPKSVPEAEVTLP